MNWDAIDWAALGRLRAAYLSGSACGLDYWQTESDLVSYDATFAQRIGWKWDYVLTELARRGWEPPPGELLDWGCGSGVAGRAFLDHFTTQSVTSLRVCDRSEAAMNFAARRAREKYPGLAVNLGMSDAKPDNPAVGVSVTGHQIRAGSKLNADKSSTDATARGTNSPPISLLISHVLTELNLEQIEALLELARRAQCVLWVEPGTHEVSRRLIDIRERLRECFHLVAPCTHEAPCGMLTPENERHWCHHFARPPREIFTDANWSRFARITGIDLRSLPLSFLVLDQRPSPALPVNAGRVIGRPRLYKAHALLLGCDATGVRERRIRQRNLPSEFRQLKKSTAEVLCIWECAQDEILAISPLPERTH